MLKNITKRAALHLGELCLLLQPVEVAGLLEVRDEVEENGRHAAPIRYDEAWLVPVPRQ